MKVKYRKTLFDTSEAKWIRLIEEKIGVIAGMPWPSVQLCKVNAVNAQRSKRFQSCSQLPTEKCVNVGKEMARPYTKLAPAFGDRTPGLWSRRPNLGVVARRERQGEGGREMRFRESSGWGDDSKPRHKSVQGCGCHPEPRKFVFVGVALASLTAATGDSFSLLKPACYR